MSWETDLLAIRREKPALDASLRNHETNLGGSPKPSFTREDLDITARRLIADAEEKAGVPSGSTQVHVNTTLEMAGFRIRIDRTERNDEEDEQPGLDIKADPYEVQPERIIGQMREAIGRMVSRGADAWRRETAWFKDGVEHKPLWAYSMHPVHRALIGSRMPSEDHLHPRRAGPHRCIIPGLTKEHGDQQHQREAAVMMHLDGVIVLERAALTWGGVNMELGTTGRQMWIRLLSRLPDTVQAGLHGEPLGRLIETGCAHADEATITGIVSGVRGDRIILEDILLPLAEAPEGADVSWRHTTFEPLQTRFANKASRIP